MRTPILILTATIFPGSLIADDSSLVVHAETAVAQIQAVTSGRKLIRLPALEFILSVRVECNATESPETVSISVADTYTTLATSDFQDGNEISATVRISAKQLAPVAVAAFCVTDDTGTQRTLLKRELLTAQASLKCAGENSQTMRFVAVPLDVELSCASGDEDPNGLIEL